MPRDGSNIYHRPPGTDGIPDTTIESAKYNAYVADVEQDLNLPRPIVAGGTGASSADQALDNLSAEKFKQVITNWDVGPWRAGSFYAATTASGAAPVAGHAFAGIAYYANATDFVLTATDLFDPANPVTYTRVMAAGVWSPWMRMAPAVPYVPPNSAGSQIGEFVFDNTITFPPAAGQVRFNNAVQNSTTEIFIAHLTATNVDITTSLPFWLRTGYDLHVADKTDITKYKVFTVTADPVLSGSDIRVTVKFKNGGVDLTNAQRVLMGATGGSSVRYDIAQTLTAPQQVQARQNIYAAPFDALAYNGMQLNGSIDINQQWPGTALTTVGGYPVDGWFYFKGAAMTVVPNVTQVSIPTAVPGLPNWLAVFVITAQPALGAGDDFWLDQRIEGYRFQRLSWGTAAAQPMTIGFWTAHNRTGVYGGSVRNSAQNRSYAFTYTQNVSDTPQYNVVTIPGDTTGTWLGGNSIGCFLTFGVAIGSTYVAPAANAWLAGNYHTAPGQVNGVAATSDVFRITGVVVLPGIEAPPAARSPYIMRPLDQELPLCLRYYEKSYDHAVLPGTVTQLGEAIIDIRLNTVSLIGGACTTFFKAAKRAQPTILTYSPITGAVGKIRDDANSVDVNTNPGGIGTTAFFNLGLCAATAGVLQMKYHWTADARL